MTRWLVTTLAVVAVAAVPARAQEKKETAHGASDGIKVHGHWTIDVKNPDGSLASHNEFENALLADGAGELSKLLGRQETVVGWAVVLDGIGFIIEPAVVPTCPCSTFNQSLTVAVPASGPNAGSIILSGSIQAQNLTQVSSVSTLVVGTGSCGSGCYSDTAFSATDLKTPVSNIQPGQIVQVTVIFSFS